MNFNRLFEDENQPLPSVDELVWAYFKFMMERFNGHKARAYTALGISKRTLNRWIRKERIKGEE